MNRIRRGTHRDDDATRDETDDDGCEHVERRKRENAACEMLEYFAFGTVVIVRMRRAARDRRSIDVAMAGMGVTIGYLDAFTEIVDDIRQRPERRPRERDERAPGDADAPRLPEKRSFSAAASNRHPRLATCVGNGARIPRRRTVNS